MRPFFRAKPEPTTAEQSGRRGEPPPLRVDDAEDDFDARRAAYVFDLFNVQDPGYRLRDRDIEENCRMLASQQWWVYHHLLGWHDISYWMSDQEKRWRQRPVFNRILPWFILTHARMTENPFICTFLPGPDQHDAELAEMLDALYKVKWRDTGMTDVWARCAAWMIAAGMGFQQSRIDPKKGEWEEWVGKASLSLLGPDGQPVMGGDGQPIVREIPNGVPFDQAGNPLAELRPDGLHLTGKPHRERKGDLVIDVHSPLEVRGQWGPLPWHEQSRHMVRSYLTPEQIYERYRVEVEPDITDLPAGSAGFLERLLFSSGFYGAASGGPEVPATPPTSSQGDGYTLVQSNWFAPSEQVEGTEETPESPGGRLLVTTKNKTLSDGVRPFRCKWTSPIRCYEFIRLPGRMGGSTPLEMMKSPQKGYNQGWKQIYENRSLAANPQQVYDLDSGLRADQIDNMPGRQYGVRLKKGVEPIKWIVPPAMGADVWRSQTALAQELQFLGSQTGTEFAQQVSKQASGELVRELRFNDDRFLGPTMIRAAEENGRMIEDWRAMVAVLYTEQTILRYVGEDQAARAVLLMPDLLSTATADTVPDIESMRPEGRGERRARVYQMWKDGAFGEPKSPAALRMLHDLGRFPNMAQTALPGGVHRATARQENGKMLQGQVPIVQEWQDHEVHLDAHETFMATLDWERLPEEIKNLFIAHRRATMTAMIQKQRQAQMMAIAAQVGPEVGGAPAGAPAPGGPGPAPAPPAEAGAETAVA